MKNVFRLILLYLALFILGTVGYITSFHTPLFRNMDVFFYRGLSLIFLFGVIISVLFLVLKKTLFPALIEWKDILLLFFLFCCVNTVFFTHVPVTGERSISVFMLGYMAAHETESWSQDEMAQIFIDHYVYEMGAFEKRFHEQEVTGTIRETGDGKYTITESGKALIRMYEIIGRWYGTDDLLIHGNDRS